MRRIRERSAQRVANQNTILTFTDKLVDKDQPCDFYSEQLDVDADSIQSLKPETTRSEPEAIGLGGMEAIATRVEGRERQRM